MIADSLRVRLFALNADHDDGLKYYIVSDYKS
jgi:hypothetical protein